MLTRYYFLNNANLWFWVLYGNDKTKTLEIAPTNIRIPEVGGRFPVSHSQRRSGIVFTISGSPNGRPQRFDPCIWQSPRRTASALTVNGTWASDSGLKGMDHQKQEYRDPDKPGISSHGADYTFGIGNGIYRSFRTIALCKRRTAVPVHQYFFSGFRSPTRWVF